MAIQIVDSTIKVLLQAMISYVSNDYENAATKSDTYLYRIFNGITFGGWNYYEQAIEVLINRKDNSPRKLIIREEFDPSRAKTPSIFINVPSEQFGGENSIGIGQSDENWYDNSDGTETEKYIRDFDGTYELMITSDNMNEVKLIYEFLKCMLTSLYDTFSETFNGTWSMSGKQLMANQDVMPGVYMRTVNLKLVSRIEVPRIDANDFGNDIVFVQENITI